MGKFIGKATDFLGLTDIEGTRKRGEKAAAQARAAAERASEMARFKPYNVRTALGGVNFGPQSVSIDYDPALAAYRQSLFSLAPTLVPTDIRAAEEAEYQRNIEAARRTLGEVGSQLGTTLFRTGRAGLDIYGAQPELRAFNAAVLDQERAARAAASAKVLGDIASSESLFKAGLGVEEALLQPLKIGASLGQQQAAAGAQAGQILSSGLTQAAATQLAAGNAASKQMTDFTNKLLTAAVGSFSGSFGGTSGMSSSSGIMQAGQKYGWI